MMIHPGSVWGEFINKHVSFSSKPSSETKDYSMKEQEVHWSRKVHSIVVLLVLTSASRMGERIWLHCSLNPKHLLKTECLHHLLKFTG